MSSTIMTLYQDINEILTETRERDKELTSMLKGIQLCFREAQARCEIVEMHHAQGLEPSVERRETFKETKRKFENLRDELKDLVEVLFAEVWPHDKEVESFYDSGEE